MYICTCVYIYNAGEAESWGGVKGKALCIYITEMCVFNVSNSETIISVQCFERTDVKGAINHPQGNLFTSKGYWWCHSASVVRYSSPFN